MSEQPFQFESWFDSLNTSKYVHDEYKQALLELVEHKLNVSRFVTSHNLIPNNLGFIEKDNNDKYFVDIELPRVGDITTGFVAYPHYGSEHSGSEINLKIRINNIVVPVKEDTIIPNACAIYTEIKMRVIFEKEPFPIRVKYTSYVLDSKLRLELIKQTFIHDSIKYSNGVAIPSSTIMI